MTKLERMTNDQMSKHRTVLCSSFPRCASFVIRLSSFVIRSPRRSLAKAGHSSFGIGRSAFLVLMAQMCCSALAQAQAPNMTGTWNVEITFANERHHSLRLEAQDGGKGSLQLTDPAAKVRKFRDILGASGISPRQCRARRGDIDLQREIRNRRFDFRRSGIFSVGGRAPIQTRHVQSGPCSKITKIFSWSAELCDA